MIEPGLFPVLLTAVLLSAGGSPDDPRDTVLVGEGGAIGPPGAGSHSHLAICSPDDCPTCYEFVLAEVERLTREPVWKGRWAVIVASPAAVDTTFARWIRDRYDPPVPLFNATRRTIALLIARDIPSTPCIVFRNAAGEFGAPWTIAPRTQAATTRFFDSLFTAGPGRGVP